MSKFSEFITSKKLDIRRILSTSAHLEKLRPEDRVIRLAHRQKSEDKKPEGAKKKPRSGRPVTPRALDAALNNKPLSGPQKTRFLRAINKLLEKKKQEPIALDALF